MPFSSKDPEGAMAIWYLPSSSPWTRTKISESNLRDDPSLLARITVARLVRRIGIPASYGGVSYKQTFLFTCQRLSRPPLSHTKSMMSRGFLDFYRF